MLADLNGTVAIEDGVHAEDSAVDRAIELMREGLPSAFDKGTDLDYSLYDEYVYFEDPTTKLWGISKLKKLMSDLQSQFSKITYTLFRIQKTSPRMAVARWSMTFTLPSEPLPLPPIVVTGETSYTFNEHGRIIGHIDYWDSVSRENNLWEAVLDLGRTTATNLLLTAPPLYQPNYTVVRRYADFDVRQYDPIVLAQVPMRQDALSVLSGSGSSFRQLAGYIFGGNDRGEKMDMTTPVFTDLSTNSVASSMAFVLESDSDGNAPAPLDAAVQVRTAAGSVVAVLPFGGIAAQPWVEVNQRRLESLLAAARLRIPPGATWRLAQYNDPFTNPLFRRNEIMIDVCLDD